MHNIVPRGTQPSLSSPCLDMTRQATGNVVQVEGGKRQLKVLAA
jgi:hypothetical protein